MPECGCLDFCCKGCACCIAKNDILREQEQKVNDLERERLDLLARNLTINHGNSVRLSNRSQNQAQEIERLRSEVNRLRNNRDYYKTKRDEIKNERDEIENQVEDLIQKFNNLKTELEKLKNENQELKEKIASINREARTIDNS